jgi:hypothetical protein
MNASKKAASLALGTAVVFATMSWSGDLPGTGDSLFATAHAVIGRPFTPVSYAGVARRTTRRVAYTGAAAASAAAASAAAANAAAANAAAANAAAANAAAAAAAPKQTTTVIVEAAPPAGCVKSIDATGATIYRCP